jgi:hypothetical protein
MQKWGIAKTLWFTENEPVQGEFDAHSRVNSR